MVKLRSIKLKILQYKNLIIKVTYKKDFMIK